MRYRKRHLTALVLLAGLLCAAAGIPATTLAGAATTGTAARTSALPASCAQVKSDNPSIAGHAFRIGTDPEAPPFEDVSSSGTLVGFDIDMIKAVMGCIGATYSLSQIKFAGLIPAMQAKHIDAIISSLVATTARLKVVNFVTYVRQQEGLLVLKGNPDHLDSIASLCGHSVSVFPGSLELAFVTAEAPKCTAAGKKPVEPAVFDNMLGTIEAVVQHRADASIMPPPYGKQAEEKFPGKLEMTPNIAAFNSSIGIAIPKTSGALGKALNEALKVIQSSGDEQKLMEKWKLTSNLFEPTKILS
jgi:polar amino acid transport system substrate-binding protein